MLLGGNINVQTALEQSFQVAVVYGLQRSQWIVSNKSEEQVVLVGKGKHICFARGQIVQDSQFLL